MMKILFMGTPDFAVFSLRALCEAGEEVVGVVTQPDKPQGRGYTITPPPVKVYAESREITVYQPKTLRDEAFAELLDKIAPDMIIVAAYGKILPENVINYPKLGCINVHGSYLPRYRGAAPMQRAIIDGCIMTGVTIMDMDIGIDTGRMLARKKIRIGADDDFENIHDRLGLTGAEMLLETLEKIKNGEVKRVKQYNAYATYAAKISKEECRVDFGKTAKQVHDLIRGLSPMPLAMTKTPDGKLLKIISSELTGVKTDAQAGFVTSVDGAIFVACGDELLKITRVLPEGRQKMDADAFARGRGVAAGDILKWQ